MSKTAYYLSMLKRVRPVRAMPKVWNYAKYRFYKKLSLMSCRRYTPQIAGLLLTRRCNLNCGYCNVAKFLSEQKGDWRESEASLDKVKHIFANKLFRNSLLVDLLGGEPLLVKDLDRIIAFLTENGCLSNTSTNGVLLGERVADLKQAGISRINISLYDANRSVLERDLGRINRIFPVHASIVLLRSQIEGQPEKLLQAVRFIRSEGCLSLRFWMYRPLGVNPKTSEVILEGDPVYVDFRRQRR